MDNRILFEKRIGRVESWEESNNIVHLSVYIKSNFVSQIAADRPLYLSLEFVININ